MKQYVLFSTDFKPHKGGVAEFVYNIANFLQEKKLLKRIITYTPHENETFDYTVVLTNIKKRNRKLEKRFGDGFFFTRKINTLIHKIVLHYLAYKDLKPILKNKSDIKIIICSYYTYDNGIFINMCRFLNIEYEILYHGLDIMMLLKFVPEQFYRNTKKASRIIFNSKATKNLFLSNFQNFAIKNVVVYPMIDTEKILKTETFDLEKLEKIWKIQLKQKHIISCVAALGKRKGVKIAVSAMAKLVKLYPDYIFLIGGKGPERENLLAQIKELKLENNVHLLGLISDKEKYSLLNYSEIFVLPSSGLKGIDWEGFGISYIEASLFENIVIGGNHGGVPEAIDNNKSGFLIDFDSENCVDELYTKFINIIENKENKMGKYGKNYVIDNFSINNFNDFFL